MSDSKSDKSNASSNRFSKTQQELYDAIKAGAVVLYDGFDDPPVFYRYDGNVRRCNTTAKALLSKGAAKLTNDRTPRLILTEQPK